MRNIFQTLQVNGANLAEVTGGEVAVTNLHSCNGPDFTLQLHFSQDVTSTLNLGKIIFYIKIKLLHQLRLHYVLLLSTA